MPATRKTPVYLLSSKSPMATPARYHHSPRPLFQTSASATQHSTQNRIAGVSGYMTIEKNAVCGIMLNHSVAVMPRRRSSNRMTVRA